MAPEQARGEAERVNQRSDIFSLGAVLYYLLAGRAPFEAAEFGEALDRARRADFDRTALRRPGIPRRLCEACLRAMAPTPEGRYTTMEAFAQDLEVAARGPRPRPWVLATCALVLAAAALGWRLGWGVPPGAPAPETPAPGVVWKPSLEVRVWRAGVWHRHLTKAVPLREGDEIQVRAEVPPGVYTSFFVLNGRGRWSRVCDLPPGNVGVPFR
jgi:hypothetical protein